MDEGEHEQREKYAQRTYVCGACGESFESEEDLQRHLYAVGLVD